jgi:hypothetical protein
MYEWTPDGRRFFVDNPLRRYAIGDRSRSLKRNPDGSLRMGGSVCRQSNACRECPDHNEYVQ